MLGDDPLAFDQIGRDGNATVYILEVRRPAIDQSCGGGVAARVVGKCCFGEASFAIDRIQAGAWQTFAKRRIGSEFVVEQIWACRISREAFTQGCVGAELIIE